MSFKENAYQQMSFTDSFSGLTAREQKALERSWAKVFADEIFPAIDEKRFSVLYSDKASRPNTPVNVIVGALIIKELFDYSDDEMVENLMLDFRIQYALHTTSFEEQPLADFEFNEEGTKVLRCPAGHSPKSCSYMKQSNQCAVSFLHEQCANCPYRDQCKPKIYKRVAKIVTSKAAHERAKIQRKMSSEEFKNYARLRNGVETVPSNIRKNYHLEKMPRGKQRGKFFFGSKIAALNFRKLFNYVKGLGNYAQNPVLA